jgi:homoserine dehydrogenase
MLFYGRGAGENPTTSAILADLLDVCKFIDLGKTSKDFFHDKNIKGIKPISEIETKFYIRFMVIDKPGVLAKISGILGSCGISIASVTQKERRKSQVVPIIMLTHEAKEGNMRIALSKISKLNIIKKKPVAIRMES